MDDTLLKVIEKLTERTRAGRVEWEDVSPGFSSDRFRAVVDDVSVEVMDGERVSEQPFAVSEPQYVSYYRVVVFSPNGRSVASSVQEHGEKEYDRLGDLFDAARTAARKSGTVLQHLLTTLSK